MLRKIVDYCYTDEVCFESVSQTLDLMKFAVAYDITDLTEKCRLYLNSSMTVKTEPCPEPQTLKTTQSLVIFGSLDEDSCFGGAMLDPIDGKWKELAPMIESQKHARRLTSVAYRGNDFVIVSGGMDEEKSKQVSVILISSVYLCAFSEFFNPLAGCAFGRFESEKNRKSATNEDKPM